MPALQIERAVRSPLVVVTGADAKNVWELAAADDQHSVEALAAASFRLVSTAKKSQTRIDSPCACRKLRQDWRPRSCAGCTPALMSMFRTDLAETVMPSLRSSPTIRRYPRLGLSPANSRISRRTSPWINQRPGLRCG
jgi:hypothetical protein